MNASETNEDGTPALCASCDRCRARKTKCDGQRPCGSCATKYMKKHKITSVDEVPLEALECVYSPAKRRGPIPGKHSTGQTRKSSDMNDEEGLAAWQQQAMEQAQQPQQHYISPSALLQAAIPSFAIASNNNMMNLSNSANNSNNNLMIMSHGNNNNSNGNLMADASRRIKQRPLVDTNGSTPSIPRTITNHTHLLEPNDPDGSRLYAYYRLSIDEMYHLPLTVRHPADVMADYQHHPWSGAALAAISAAQFAELALGALVHNEVAWAMELCNAVVHCLRESVVTTSNTTTTTPVGGDSAQFTLPPPIQFELARAYFLLGVFRACRGDMSRYFKYRSVCMTYLGKLEPDDKTAVLMAAISFLDAWAYMVYNGNEKDLPPGCVPGARADMVSNNRRSNKYGIDTNIQSIARDPRNRNWIQGAPPVYLNNEAPLHARSLDAVACAVRTCCDQANTRFAAIAKEAGQDGNANHNIPAGPEDQASSFSLTTMAVMSHENELCSRNIVLSAYTLMQQHDALNKGRHKYDGLHMVISVMDAFLENSDDESQGGFTDSQIQSLLSVCNTTLENPFLLHHAGPTYHMITNAAVLLCHLLNGMYMMETENSTASSMEESLFDEVLDTFLPIRKLLTIHRRKLPVKLRCHGIPRPNFRKKKGEALVDLGETLLCPCRGCQGFVLMACSPCVAAERARAATHRVEIEEAQELEAMQLGEVDKELDDLGAEFDLDDDALLGLIGNLVSD